MLLSQRPVDGPIDLPALQRRDPRRFPLLLQSAAGGNALSRWDILFIADGTGLQLRHGETRTLDGVRADMPFLAAFDAAFAAARGEAAAELPFSGGWALYLGYEAAAQMIAVSDTVFQTLPAAVRR